MDINARTSKKKFMILFHGYQSTNVKAKVHKSQRKRPWVSTHEHYKAKVHNSHKKKPWVSKHEHKSKSSSVSSMGIKELKQKFLILIRKDHDCQLTLKKKFMILIHGCQRTLKEKFITLMEQRPSMGNQRTNTKAKVHDSHRKK